MIDRYPGVCIFHDFYLASLFLDGWLASRSSRPRIRFCRQCGETVAKEFWDRLRRRISRVVSRQAPMTEWLAQLWLLLTRGVYKRRLEESCPNCVLYFRLLMSRPSTAASPALSGRVHLLTVGLVNSNKRVESVIEAITFSPVLRGRCE